MTDSKYQKRTRLTLILQTVVSIYQWAMHHDEKNFTAPSEFHPERFLGDPRFANDNRDAAQAFHLGPRGCLGKQ